MKKLIFVLAVALTACNSPKAVEPATADSTAVDSCKTCVADSCNPIIDTIKK